MALSAESTVRTKTAAPAAVGAPVHQPGAAAPASATETRLRLIIESAPVSLTITTPDGTILAANARALRLFNVERLEAIIGTKFDRLVAEDDRAQVAAAVESVCKGGDAHLTYRIAGNGNAGRPVEMRAVPLRRDGAASAVCLGATWEAAEVKADVKPAAAGVPAADVQALEQALAEARAALDTMTRTREAERLAVGDALLQTRQRLQAALSESEERYAAASVQWAAERETLSADLSRARDAAQAGSTQLAQLAADLSQARDAAAAAAGRAEASQAELTQARAAAEMAAADLLASQSQLAQARDAARIAEAELASSHGELAAAHGELAAARDAAVAAAAQLAAAQADLLQTREAAMMTATQLAASNGQRLRAEELLAAGQRRIADLERIVRELEERCAQVIADRQADRLEFHEMVRTEQTKYATLVSHQAEREAALADISRLLQDAALRTERLLGTQGNSNEPQVGEAAPAAASETTPPIAAGFGEEASWQF